MFRPLKGNNLAKIRLCIRRRKGLSQRPHDKDIGRGGEYHRLHVQFRPPDDGPVTPETCRGK